VLLKGSARLPFKGFRKNKKSPLFCAAERVTSAAIRVDTRAVESDGKEIHFSALAIVADTGLCG
jgi:hypothetical protein